MPYAANFPQLQPFHHQQPCPPAIPLHLHSAALLEVALVGLGGECTGGPPKLDPITAQKQKIKDYGYMHMDKWDLLISITAKAMLAAEVLRPGQLVSIVPGCLTLSRKTSLVRTLVNTYGAEMAFTMVPRTFKLPDEMDQWADWIKANPEKVGAKGCRLKGAQRALEPVRQLD